MANSVGSPSWVTIFFFLLFDHCFRSVFSLIFVFRIFLGTVSWVSMLGSYVALFVFCQFACSVCLAVCLKTTIGCDVDCGVDCDVGCGVDCVVACVVDCVVGCVVS